LKADDPKDIAHQSKALKNFVFIFLALVATDSVSRAEAQNDTHLVTKQEATHFNIARKGVLFHRPEGMPAPGPYYTCLVQMDKVAGFPFDYALYFSTDHHEKGGIWLYLCKGIPSEARDWKSYDQAVADGDFDYLKVKPEKNPVFSDTVQGASSETPHANVIGGKVYMTYHNIVGGKRGQVTLLATSPDGINFSRIHGDKDSVILEGANHTGYFRWAPNRFAGIRHRYVGYSLFGGGTNFRSAMWVSDDAIRWKREQIFRPMEGHAMPEADRLLIWHGMDPNSITPLGNGKYVALCTGGTRASGSMPRIVELYEIFLAADGKTLYAESRKVMKEGAAGSDDAEEVSEPTTALIGDTWHMIYVGAKNQGKENTVMSATGKLDKTAPESRKLGKSDWQRHFDGK
jgi:hypothetical protein